MQTCVDGKNSKPEARLEPKLLKHGSFIPSYATLRTLLISQWPQFSRTVIWPHLKSAKINGVVTHLSMGYLLHLALSRIVWVSWHQSLHSPASLSPLWWMHLCAFTVFSAPWSSSTESFILSSPLQAVILFEDPVSCLCPPVIMTILPRFLFVGFHWHFPPIFLVHITSVHRDWTYGVIVGTAEEIWTSHASF